MNLTVTFCLLCRLCSACPIWRTNASGTSTVSSLEVERRDQVLHARAPRLTFAVAELADRLRAADLDALDLVGDDDVLDLGLGLALVVPDLDLDAPVQRPALVAWSFGAIGWVSPAHSKEIASGGSASAFWMNSATSPARSRERPCVVAVDPGEPLRQRLVVGVADEVQPHVLEVAHPVEHRCAASRS